MGTVFIGSAPKTRLVFKLSCQALKKVWPWSRDKRWPAAALLATTNTGAEDLFTDEHEGFIVPIRDADALLNRMQRVADDPALHEWLRAASLERVKSIGRWQQYGDQWEALLKKLTVGRNRV